jgi:hypothetical protein
MATEMLRLASRTLKDKLPTPMVAITTVLQNRQVIMPAAVLVYSIV